jgi:hypothetical protein
VIFPVTGLLPPSSADRSAHLAPALERQNHTISPSATASFVSRRIASIASRLAYRDDREAPLSSKRDEQMKHLIWGNREANYFCRGDWTAKISLKRLEKLVFWRNQV